MTLRSDSSTDSSLAPVTANQPELAPAPPRPASYVFAAVLIAYAGLYLGLAVAGTYFFIFKTLVVPALVAYALVSPAAALFVRSWSPFLAYTILFDSLRGLAFAGVQVGLVPARRAYVIELERVVTGIPAAPIAVQFAFREEWLDRLFVAIHGSHFVFFFLFGLAVFHYRPREFWRFRRTLLCVMAGGLVGYFLLPTAPPFIAAAEGYLPPVVRIVDSVYNTHVPELYGALDTNPVAAMPSLHVAFPVACSLLAWRLFAKPAAIGVSLYAVLAFLGSIYLGEHYAVDGLAGALLAAAATGAVQWFGPPASNVSMRRALVGPLIITILAFLFAMLAGLPARLGYPTGY